MTETLLPETPLAIVPNSLEILVKSRERVKIYGEVFTPARMVHQMLDLVWPEIETAAAFVDKTFFEPAAGDGNFLVVILARKLAAIASKCDRTIWTRESLFALASIYAIELLEDNHNQAKNALLQIFVGFHESHGVPCSPRTDLYRAAAFLVEANVQRGDTLTGRSLSGTEIHFSWWTRQDDAASAVRREPFTFNSMREHGILDFTEYRTYEPCQIHHVHKRANAHV